MRLSRVICLSSLPLAFLSCGNSEDPLPSVEPARIAAHVKFLSSDLLEGRGINSRGEALTTEYLATQFALLGAKPAGDAGTYFQRVPLVGVRTVQATKLLLAGSGRTVKLTQGENFVAINHRQEAKASIDAEAVYVGHGIMAPEYGWDDYKGVDVKGKIAVLFTQEPGADNPELFNGKALTYYGRWTFKYEEAVRQGAAGVIIVHTEPTAGYPWAVVQNSWGKAKPYVRLEPGQPALSVAAWVTSEKGQEIVAGTGKTIDELLEAAESRDFQPIPLGLRLRGEIHSEVSEIGSSNVLAVIEGSDPAAKEEAVIYTAHWDHLGIDPNRSGDNIYNGAVDNATGCGILLEIARAFAERSEPPRRSIVFAAVGAEEGGLRGSQYYASHPIIPLGKTAANINFDGLLPEGPTSTASVPGYERTTLKETVDSVAARFGLELLPDPYPEQGYYYRSDHFSLAKGGVPALSVKGAAGGHGSEAREAYNSKHYHQPSDEFDPEWDFRGLAALAQFGFELGLRIAESPEMPTWQDGDEFLAAREESIR